MSKTARNKKLRFSPCSVLYRLFLNFHFDRGCTRFILAYHRHRVVLFPYQIYQFKGIFYSISVPSIHIAFLTESAWSLISSLCEFPRFRFVHSLKKHAVLVGLLFAETLNLVLF